MEVEVKSKPIYGFVHALPNAWLPVPGKYLTVQGISAEHLKQRLANTGAEVVSYVRYEDHAVRISQELGIDLEASGANAPSPYTSDCVLVVAALTPGTTSVNYMLVHDGTDIIQESGIYF